MKREEEPTSGWHVHHWNHTANATIPGNTGRTYLLIQHLHCTDAEFVSAKCTLQLPHRNVWLLRHGPVPNFAIGISQPPRYPPLCRLLDCYHPCGPYSSHTFPRSCSASKQTKTNHSMSVRQSPLCQYFMLGALPSYQVALGGYQFSIYSTVSTKNSSEGTEREPILEDDPHLLLANFGSHY